MSAAPANKSRETGDSTGHGTPAQPSGATPTKGKDSGTFALLVFGLPFLVLVILGAVLGNC